MGLKNTFPEDMFTDGASEVTPLQMLDLVLQFFKANANEMYLNTEKIRPFLLSKNIKINGHNMLAVVKKLQKDEYITIDQRNGRCSITFDGIIFIGYARQIAIDARNERRIIRNERLLLYWTATASIIAFLLLAWQVYSYLFPCERIV